MDTIDNENLLLASRNVKRAKVVGANGVNIYDVLYHEKLVFSRSAAETLSSLLDPKTTAKAEGAADEEAEPQAGAENEEEAA